MASRVTASVTAPRLRLSTPTLVFDDNATATLTLAVGKAAAAGIVSSPAYFMLTIEGAGLLPTRRWVQAV